MMKYGAKFFRQKTPAVVSYIKLRKGRALRKHSLHGETGASVLLKLFIMKDCLTIARNTFLAL